MPQTRKEKFKDWIKSCGGLYLLVLGMSLGLGIVLLPIVLPIALIGGVIYSIK